MVKMETIEKAIACYLDDEFMPKLKENSWQKLLTGTAISICIKRFGNITKAVSSNKALLTLGVVDADGNVDVELLCTEMKNNMTSSGVKVEIPIVGNVTFHQDDLDKLYQRIKMLDTEREVNLYDS